MAVWASPLVSATADTYIFAVATAPSGNVWTGGIQGSVPILKRFSSAGRLQITVPFSTVSGGAGIYGIATDSAGSAYAVGGVLNPDATIAGVTVNPRWSAGPTVMIVKLDSSGNFQGLQSITSAPYSSNYQGVAVDSTNGLVYAEGRDMNNDTYNFSGGITNNSGVSGLFNNFLVVQFTTGGLTQWAVTSAPGTATASASHFSAVAVDAAQNADAAGTATNFFVAEYDPNGNARRSQPLGGNGLNRERVRRWLRPGQRIAGIREWKNDHTYVDRLPSVLSSVPLISREGIVSLQQHRRHHQIHQNGRHVG